MTAPSESTEEPYSVRSSVVSVHCATCGNNPDKANRLADLEDEVRMLTDKATAAGIQQYTLPYQTVSMLILMCIVADRLADAEEEIRHLKGIRTDSPVDGQTTSLHHPDGRGQTVASSLHFADGRGQTVATSLHLPDGRPDMSRMTSAPEADSLSRRPSLGRFSFLSPKKALPTLPPAKGDYAELEAALARETHLREEAEKKAAVVEGEIEELSATLFEQANEMVSTERKEKAALLDRIAILEQKDKERAKRLDRIVDAMKRLDRVKSLLSP